jgi:hypothetical protein
LAYHDARKLAAIAGGVPAKEIPAEALFADAEMPLEEGLVEAAGEVASGEVTGEIAAE